MACANNAFLGQVALVKEVLISMSFYVVKLRFSKKNIFKTIGFFLINNKEFWLTDMYFM